jgi:hypothetical protein
MSRDYTSRSRSRSRNRGSSRLDKLGHDSNDHSHEDYANRRKDSSDTRGGHAWDDAQLAEDFGYSTSSRDIHRQGGLGSFAGISAAKPEQASEPRRNNLQETTNRADTSDDWGYTPKPYVPQAIPVNLPILANPVVHPPPPPPPSSAIPVGAHVVLENVPADLNIMSLLYDHFKQFGEVQSIHCITKHNKALVDYASRELADRAILEPVLGIPTIKASVYNGPSRGIGRQMVPPANQPKASPGAPSGLTKNLVFESEAARQAREKREKQAEADKKRQEILMAYTEHIKQIVAKLADKTLKEEVRAKYQEMLETVKMKISDLQKVEAERRKKEQEAMQKALAIRYKAYEKQARLDSSKRQQELTLDLRSRCVRISELPEELSQSIVLVEYLRAMGMQDLEDVIWLAQRTAAVLRFANHAAADSLVKHELAFKADWVPNEEAKNLAMYNEVEKVEILPLDEEEEAELMAVPPPS